MGNGPGSAPGGAPRKRETVRSPRMREEGTRRRQRSLGTEKAEQRPAAGTEIGIADSRLKKPAPEKGEFQKRSRHKTKESLLRGEDCPPREKAGMKQKQDLRPRSERPAPGRERVWGRGDVSSLLPPFAQEGEKPPAGTGRESRCCTKGAPETAWKREKRRSPCCLPGELTPAHTPAVCLL